MDEVELNVVALLRLTRAALGAMERAPLGGAILNVSSLAAYQPTPQQRDLRRDQGVRAQLHPRRARGARGTGVRVMLVCPGYTHTEFHDRAGLGCTDLPEFVWQSADAVVAAALPRPRPGPGGVASPAC